MPYVYNVQLFDVSIIGQLEDKEFDKIEVKSFSQADIIEEVGNAIKLEFESDNARLKSDENELAVRKQCLKFTLQQLEMLIDYKEELEKHFEKNKDDIELQTKLVGAIAEISSLETVRDDEEINLDYYSRAVEANKEFLDNIANGKLADYKVIICMGQLFVIHGKHNELSNYSGQVIKEAEQEEPLLPNEDMKSSFDEELIGE
ncbi:hypothetical protein BX667DRAFT_508040 [Coemansia mojavensis]|nr:hypothetical protein BX667DRAFT_508040 [Coemansia mojavensis]